MSSLRVADVGDLPAASEALGLPVAALAPALMQPALRLLVGGAGEAVLLQRQWSDTGVPEAVVPRARGVPPDHRDVLRAGAGWGCEVLRTATGKVGIPAPDGGAGLTERFRHFAALAASRVEAAVAASDPCSEGHKGDGSPVTPADDAAHRAAAEVLERLGVPLLSEERRDRPVGDDEPWIVLDPLDGTGNFSAGMPPWAFSAALVRSGRAVAGLVADLSSGRRWEGVVDVGAWRDGRAIRPRRGTTVVVPSAPAGQAVRVPAGARRVRITGSTAVDLCLVADGAAAAWHDLDRSGSHVHDVAGGLAVLTAAGGVALGADGRPVNLASDTDRLIKLVAAADEETARGLLGEFA